MKIEIEIKIIKNINIFLDVKIIKLICRNDYIYLLQAFI